MASSPWTVGRRIVSEVIDEVFHLKNSVAKHRPAEEFAAIRSRIARTRERLENTAWQLEQFGSAKAAGYLRRWLPSIVTFAEHAVEGFDGSVDLEPVERLMGEVSKRLQEPVDALDSRGIGSDNPTSVGEVRRPEYYQAFLDELLQRSTKTVKSTVTSQLRVPAAKVFPFALCKHDQSLGITGILGIASFLFGWVLSNLRPETIVDTDTDPQILSWL